jgi:hypothetical protein
VVWHLYGGIKARGAAVAFLAFFGAAFFALFVFFAFFLVLVFLTLRAETFVAFFFFAVLVAFFFDFTLFAMRRPLSITAAKNL